MHGFHKDQIKYRPRVNKVPNNLVGECKDFSASKTVYFV